MYLFIPHSVEQISRNLLTIEQEYRVIDIVV